MLSGLVSFFGGTAFRWLFGEILGFLKARQEHAQELAMLKLQHEIEREKNEWQRAAIKEQAEAGVKVIAAQAEARAQELADLTMLEAVKGISIQTGIKFIDGFNAFIRPELAQVSILLVVGNALFPQHVVLQGVVLEVVCGVLGLFIGGRIQSQGR